MDAPRTFAAGTAAALRVLVLEDRLARWSAISLVPVAWLTLALADPRLLLLAPLAVLLLVVLFRFGPFERFEQPDDLY